MLASIYHKSPIGFQNLMTSTYGRYLHNLRYGGEFKKVLAEIEKSQWYSAEELGNLRLSLLRKMLVHCYENVPYYQESFRKVSFYPQELKDEAELSAIPIITRQDILKNSGSMVAKNFAKLKLRKHFTSGTTSSPLMFYEDWYAVRRSYAFWMRFRKWFGFSPWAARATFGGRVVVPREQKKPPFWRYNKVENQMVFSSFHISEKNVAAYVDALSSFSPFVIEGYVSSIYTLAKYINSINNTKICPVAVQTTSETLFDFQRYEIEKAFGCKVYNQYGHGEKAAFISQCEFGSLHISDEHGFIEILSDKQNTYPDETGKLIVTGFNNRVMPLIRYDTGDIAVKGAKITCECGRGLTVVESVEGRVLDILIMPDGGTIPPTALTLLFDKVTAMDIHEAQVIQKELSVIVIKLVKRSQSSGIDISLLEQDLRSMMGNSVKIHFEFVDNIPRTTQGKYRFVISEINK